MESMEAYIGSKIIMATPMRKDAAHSSAFLDRPWDGEDEDGYLVNYPDGYQSWSPKGVFDNAYRRVTEEEQTLIAS